MTDELQKPAAGELIAAVKAVDIARVKELLARGADPDEKDNRNETCLRYAVNRKSRELIELLLDNGADINLGGYNGLPPLIIAVFTIDQEIIRLLLERGADPYKEDKDGRSVIYWVYMGSFYDMDMDESAEVLSHASELRLNYLKRENARKEKEAHKKKLEGSHTAATTSQENIRSKRKRSTVKRRPAP